MSDDSLRGSRHTKKKKRRFFSAAFLYLELQVARNCEKNQYDEYDNQCIHGEDLLPPGRI